MIFKESVKKLETSSKTLRTSPKTLKTSMTAIGIINANHYFYFQTEGVWSTGIIPRGTRFGPFEGVRTPNKPTEAHLWRYFWRVSNFF